MEIIENKSHQWSMRVDALIFMLGLSGHTQNGIRQRSGCEVDSGRRNAIGVGSWYRTPRNKPASSMIPLWNMARWLRNHYVSLRFRSNSQPNKNVFRHQALSTTATTNSARLVPWFTNQPMNHSHRTPLRRTWGKGLAELRNGGAMAVDAGEYLGEGEWNDGLSWLMLVNDGISWLMMIN